MSTDFHYLFMALSVLRHPPLTIILAPPVCLAVYHAAAFANSTRIARTNLLGKKVMQPAYNALRNAQREALIFNAAAEVRLRPRLSHSLRFFPKPKGLFFFYLTT